MRLLQPLVAQIPPSLPLHNDYIDSISPNPPGRSRLASKLSEVEHVLEAENPAANVQYHPA
ncbi:hypothetical protein A1O7_03238 [Cladophialophora yegresii CBS 114405]|uniref:Uncharacterized protein n=1 Tax=Cladophialophora yegresii CBS 114405 TaxID=1182544 RepID=W9W495_9EURO|nr:uncharacterized protein A1O7_03238 [Cladophialophora yegresii CBS 114405]EXJ62798.1 hypothetical protein A1O7_03238 [Cladophialophora yegresii CBS 114405]